MYLYVDLSVWMCLCVSEEKEDEERRSLRLSSFCTEKREKKLCYTATATVYICMIIIVNV